MELTGPVIVVFLLLAVGMEIAPPIEKAVKKTGHTIVHVLTFGKK